MKTNRRKEEIEYSSITMCS